jgi:hypothetical protein
MAGGSAAVKGQHFGGNAVEQKTVVRDEHERAPEVLKAVLQDFEAGNVQVVGRLVQQEQVGGLEHEPGDQNTGLLAARQPTDRARQLFGTKQKAFGPGGNVHRAALVQHHVAVGAQRVAQGLVGVELLAVLVEPNDAQPVGPFDGPRVRRELAGQDFEQRGLARTVHAHQAQLTAGRQRQVKTGKQRPATQRFADPRGDQ